MANAFATSVGSGALTLKSAIIIAAVMEFLGAFLLGGNVAAKIMKDITNAELYADMPEVLMFGMMCVLISVAAWLILATVYGLPVSTTHSCIGGLVGMAVVSKGMKAVNWKQVGLVASSWIVSPVTSALLSTIIFILVRKYILRNRESLKQAFRVYPIIVAFTFALNIFLVLYSSKSLNLNMSIWAVVAISVVIGVALGLVLQFTFIPYVKRKISREAAATTSEITVNDVKVNIEMADVPVDLPVTIQTTHTAETTEKTAEDATELEKEVAALKAEVATRQNIHAELEDEKSKVYQMHKNAETFDPSTEKLFTYLQIITAVFNSFAHGANDVANAIGPFAFCLQLYQTGNVLESTTVTMGPLVLGGFGIIVGLACLGYKVMAAIGVNMVKVTPSRGFCIEIGSALVVIIGSTIGLPLSTTHCKVGSTVGVGLVEGKNGVNWSLLYGVFAGWIVTLFVCAISTGLIFAFAVYSPRIPSLSHVCCITTPLSFRQLTMVA